MYPRKPPSSPPSSSCPWRVRFDKQLQAVVATFNGHVDASHLHQAAITRHRLLRETGARRALLDVENIRASVTPTRLFDYPSRLYREIKAVPGIRTALILPRDPASRELAEFFATACSNRGWPIHTFETRDAALASLTEHPTDTPARTETD